MAPTTRSANKQAVKGTSPPKTFTFTRKSANKKFKKGKQVAANTAPLKCMILEMPPEIRNLIYGLCKEDFFHKDEEPAALRRGGNPAKVPDYRQARVYFSLTQTCKLIRAEYRPLWLRDSSVSIDYKDIDDFISTFYPQRGQRVDWYSNAPKLLCILWDNEKEEAKTDGFLVNLKPLLKLRSWASSSTIWFVARILSEEDKLHARCYECGHCICGECGYIRDPKARPRWCEDSDCSDCDDCNGHHHDDGCHSWDDCDCEGATEEEYRRQERRYKHLEPLNDFLANNNKRWLKLIREDFQHCLSIECTMGTTPTIYFRFQWNLIPKTLKINNMYRSACEFLMKVGVTDRPLRAKLDFVVSLPTGKFTRPHAGAQYMIPTLHQTHISGRTCILPASPRFPGSINGQGGCKAGLVGWTKL